MDTVIGTDADQNKGGRKNDGNKKVIAYCFTKNLKLMTDEDIRLLSAVHIAFGLLEDGAVAWKGKTAARLLGRMKEVNPDLKVVLSVGGWGADGFSQAAGTREGREKLAASAVSLVKSFGLDGLDIDWEYPCIGVGGISCCPEDKQNYTLLLRELRHALDGCDTYKTLSVAAGGDEYFLQSADMKEASQYLDYVQLMTYDFRGGFQIVTGHHANLYSYGGDLALSSTDRAVKLFTEAGVPASKLVAGAAFYGRIWKGVQEKQGGSGLCRMAKTTGGASMNYDEILALLEEKGAGGYRKYWDESAQAAWLFDGSNFISYEDERAIRCKAAYVKEKGLYGVMYWEYAADKSHTLTRALYEGVRQP